MTKVSLRRLCVLFNQIPGQQASAVAYIQRVAEQGADRAVRISFNRPSLHRSAHLGCLGARHLSYWPTVFMKTDPSMRRFYVGEVAAAVTLASLSFGAQSKAEKERAFAEHLGPKHPAYEEIHRRASLPAGLAKTLGLTSLIVGAMGAGGLMGSRRPE